MVRRQNRLFGLRLYRDPTQKGEAGKVVPVGGRHDETQNWTLRAPKRATELVDPFGAT